VSEKQRNVAVKGRQREAKSLAWRWWNREESEKGSRKKRWVRWSDVHVCGPEW